VENANQPRGRQAPNAGSSATKAQSSVPERQEAERSKRFETAGAEERPVDRADQADEIEHYRSQVHDYE